MRLLAATLFLLVGAAAAASSHRAAEHGDDYLPVTSGPEYVDLVTQIMAHSGRKPDFELHQRFADGLRVTEMVDRGSPPGGHSFATLIVRDAKDKKRAQKLAKAALEAEDWADIGATLPKHTLTPAQHLKTVKKNLAFIDKDASPGYVKLDLDWIKRQLDRDLVGATAVLYLVRSPRAAH